jgi:hypothetical protein
MIQFQLHDSFSECVAKAADVGDDSVVDFRRISAGVLEFGILWGTDTILLLGLEGAPQWQSRLCGMFE